MRINAKRLLTQIDMGSPTLLTIDTTKNPNYLGYRTMTIGEDLSGVTLYLNYPDNIMKDPQGYYPDSGTGTSISSYFGSFSDGSKISYIYSTSNPDSLIEQSVNSLYIQGTCVYQAYVRAFTDSEGNKYRDLDTDVSPNPVIKLSSITLSANTGTLTALTSTWSWFSDYIQVRDSSAVDPYFMLPVLEGDYSDSFSALRVDWGDNSNSVIEATNITKALCTHKYTTPGSYQLSFSGIKSGRIIDYIPYFTSGYGDTSTESEYNNLKFISVDSKLGKLVKPNSGGYATNANSMFSYTSNLSSVDATMFVNNYDNLLTYNNCFKGTGIVAFPILQRPRRNPLAYHNILDTFYRSESVLMDSVGMTSISLPGVPTGGYILAYINPLVLGSGFFSGCTNLVIASMDTNVRAIPSLLFYNCTSITTLELKGNITNIGANAFEGSGLTILTLSGNTSTVPDIPDPGGTENIFDNCTNLLAVRVAVGMKETYLADTKWSLYSSFIYEIGEAIGEIEKT